MRLVSIIQFMCWACCFVQVRSEERPSMDEVRARLMDAVHLTEDDLVRDYSVASGANHTLATNPQRRDDVEIEVMSESTM